MRTRTIIVRRRRGSSSSSREGIRRRKRAKRSIGRSERARRRVSKKRIAACGLFVGRKERGEEEEKEKEKTKGGKGNGEKGGRWEGKNWMRMWGMSNGMERTVATISPTLHYPLASSHDSSTNNPTKANAQVITNSRLVQ